MIRQIAEHNHYVQGVAWDPLNEYVATQSSDRSCHIYSLKTKDGQFSLNQHNKITKMDLPGRRISSSSPAPSDSVRTHIAADASLAPGSPAPSMPGTPTSLALSYEPSSNISQPAFLIRFITFYPTIGVSSTFNASACWYYRWQTHQIRTLWALWA